jgi:UDP-N-acetylglucosamine acyltransferase
MPVDPSAYIAPTARIHAEASVGAQCHIGEYCVVEADVVLGQGNRLEPYVYLKRWTTLGDNNEISAGTVLGTDPLDKNFSGARSYLRIGHGNRIREHYTISRATKPEATTIIGDRNYIMTTGHIAHDCVIGNDTVICSSALVAGYVRIGDSAFLSGGVVVHQHSSIGQLVMVGGNTRVNMDLPPFFLYSEFHAAARGLNIVGLRRAGIPLEEVKQLKQAYRLLYRSGLTLEDAVQRISKECGGNCTAELLRFLAASRRGIARE